MDRVHFIDRQHRQDRHAPPPLACEVDFGDFRSPPVIRPIARPAAVTTNVSAVTCRKCRRTFAFAGVRNDAWRALTWRTGHLTRKRDRKCRGARCYDSNNKCERHAEMYAEMVREREAREAKRAEEARRFPMHRTRPARPHLVREQLPVENADLD